VLSSGIKQKGIIPLLNEIVNTEFTKIPLITKYDTEDSRDNATAKSTINLKERILTTVWLID